MIYVEAGRLTRALWAIFGMSDDEDEDEDEDT